MSAKPDAGRRATSAPSFEAAMRELQGLVEQLESGDLSLEQAVHLFELATELAQTCQAALDAAELRVTRLAAESASPLSDLSPDQ